MPEHGRLLPAASAALLLLALFAVLGSVRGAAPVGAQRRRVANAVVARSFALAHSRSPPEGARVSHVRLRNAVQEVLQRPAAGAPPQARAVVRQDADADGSGVVSVCSASQESRVFGVLDKCTCTESEPADCTVEDCCQVLAGENQVILCERFGCCIRLAATESDVDNVFDGAFLAQEPIYASGGAVSASTEVGICEEADFGGTDPRCVESCAFAFTLNSVRLDEEDCPDGIILPPYVDPFLVSTGGCNPANVLVPATESDGSGSNAGVIAGATVGAVVGISLVLTVALLALRRRSHRPKANGTDPPSAPPHPRVPAQPSETYPQHTGVHNPSQPGVAAPTQQPYHPPYFAVQQQQPAYGTPLAPASPTYVPASAPAASTYSSAPASPPASPSAPMPGAYIRTPPPPPLAHNGAEAAPHSGPPQRNGAPAPTTFRPVQPGAAAGKEGGEVEGKESDAAYKAHMKQASPEASSESASDAFSIFESTGRGPAGVSGALPDVLRGSAPSVRAYGDIATEL